MINKIKQLYFNFILNSIQKKRKKIFLLNEKLKRLAFDYTTNMQIARYYRGVDFSLAYQYYAKSLKLKPDNLEVIIEFAQFLTDNNDIEKSLLLCKKALIKNKENIDVMLIMSQNYIKHGDWQKAVNNAEKVLEKDNKSKLAYSILCSAYKQMGNYEKAACYLDKWNELEGINISCEWEDGQCAIWENLLRQKKFKEGMAVLNKLFRNPNCYSVGKSKISYQYVEVPQRIRNYFKKFWKNEDLKGKTFLVCNIPCGYGDNVMYSRYIPVLAQRAKKVVVEINDNLYDLFKYSFPQCKIIHYSDKEYKNYDYSSSYELLMNLQNDFEHIYYPEGYLNVNPKSVKEMKDTGLFDVPKKKIGIFFKSSTDYLTDRLIMPQELIPLLESKNAVFYSLLKNERDRDICGLMERYGVVDLEPLIENANDTAAIMKNLDLVISIDSFPIHLAGALGVKAWVLLPCYTEWRWFMDTKTTPWYNSVTIFRQSRPDSWREVIERMKNELESFCA